MIFAPPPQVVVGTVTATHDGDTLNIGATAIRLRAIDANELNGKCHTTCAPHSAIEARDNLAKLSLGKQATCRITDVSYQRKVAWCSVDGVDLSCAQYRGGYAVRWARYDRRNELCR